MLNPNLKNVFGQGQFFQPNFGDHSKLSSWSFVINTICETMQGLFGALEGCW